MDNENEELESYEDLPILLGESLLVDQLTWEEAWAY